jgi:hypothetical protein
VVTPAWPAEPVDAIEPKVLAEITIEIEILKIARMLDAEAFYSLATFVLTLEMKAIHLACQFTGSISVREPEPGSSCTRL